MSAPLRLWLLLLMMPHSLFLLLTSCWLRSLQRRIMLGAFVLSEASRSQFFDSAQVVRQRITADFQAVFDAGVRLVPWLPRPLAWCHL